MPNKKKEEKNRFFFCFYMYHSLYIIDKLIGAIVFEEPELWNGG